MKINSDYTEEEPFRQYVITIRVETKADQDKLRGLLEWGINESHSSAHTNLFSQLLNQVD